MSQITAKGIVYPESTDNTRIWSWLQLLAQGADALIPGSVDVQTFVANGTWNAPAGALFSIVEVQGGGGGSGGCPLTSASQSACSPGGAGGEYARGTYAAATLGTGVAVTVGAAGAAGTSTTSGGAGGTSSFGAFITAVGGGGSVVGAVTTTNLSTGGSAGGSGGTGGDVRVPGDDGANSTVVGAVAIKYCNGGGSFLGAQRRPSGTAAGQGVASPGWPNGGGATGASNGPSQTAVAGAAGGLGIVIVTTLKA